MSAKSLREALAHAYDPDAFEHHPIEARSNAAAVQWGARRAIALRAADRVVASGLHLCDDKDTPSDGAA